MNKKQKAAFDAVLRALNRCGRSGLTGGIYDGSLCMWPLRQEPREMDGNFFDNVEECGGCVDSPSDITVDGGAGC